jgi:phosphatidylglycerophosphatase A
MSTSREERKLLGKVFRTPHGFMSLGFGAGLMPFAPGSWGTLVAFPIFLVLQMFFGTVSQLIFWSLLYFFGVLVSNKAARDLGVKDHSAIVIDEIVAFGLVLTLIPHELPWLIFAFAVFRFFDIAKPFPIRNIDIKWEGGNGIMADDFVAAVYSVAVVNVIVFWISTT